MDPVSDESRAACGGTVVSRSRRVDCETLVPFLRSETAPRVAWNSPDGPAIAGIGAATTVVADGPDRFETVRDRTEALSADIDADGPPVTRPRLFGGFAFHDDHDQSEPWTGFPGARFVLPELQLTITDNESWLTARAVGSDADPDAVERRLDTATELLAELSEQPVADTLTAPSGLKERGRTPPREQWRRQIRDTVDRIRTGALTKAVLASSLSGELAEELPPTDLFASLSSAYPGCRQFLFEPTDAAAFVGATPERLVSVTDRTVETAALAGTIGRGETSEEDERLASQLRDSEKNVHEHEVVVEAICEQLDPFVTATETAERRIRTLATVHHLQTPIRATLARDEHVLSLVRALHPTPAVGGRPPALALPTIREMERFDRGWYAAPVGWFDADGNGTFAVAIRSGVLAGPQATLFAGAGIVADSDPDREWAEVQLKYGPLLDALGGLQSTATTETLRPETGERAGTEEPQ